MQIESEKKFYVALHISQAYFLISFNNPWLKKGNWQNKGMTI